MRHQVGVGFVIFEPGDCNFTIHWKPVCDAADV